MKRHLKDTEGMMRRFCCLWMAALLLSSCALASEAYTVVEEVETFDAESRYEMQARYVIDSMSTREKVCQLFIITPEALTGQTAVTKADDAFAAAYALSPVGGFIYYAQNLVTREQTAALIEGVNEAARRSGLSSIPFHAVDEEGGDVARVAYRLGTTAYPNAQELGLTPDAEKTYAMGKTMAQELRALGFTVDFAPVADVSGGKDAAIGNRAFGSSPELVAALSSAMARGLQDHGMIAVMKHFPGHGSLTGNVHLARASDARSLDTFRQSDFLPFMAGIDLDIGMIMMSDMVMRSVSAAPACLSYDVVTGILRQELGYDGVIVTDALRMDAITESYTSAEAALLAIEAGCDMILLPNDFESAVTALQKAVDGGRISEERIEESLMRIMRLKLKYKIY